MTQREAIQFVIKQTKLGGKVVMMIPCHHADLGSNPDLNNGIFYLQIQLPASLPPSGDYITIRSMILMA